MGRECRGPAAQDTGAIARGGWVRGERKRCRGTIRHGHSGTVARPPRHPARHSPPVIGLCMRGATISVCVCFVSLAWRAESRGAAFGLHFRARRTARSAFIAAARIQRGREGARTGKMRKAKWEQSGATRLAEPAMGWGGEGRLRSLQQAPDGGGEMCAWKGGGRGGGDGGADRIERGGSTGKRGRGK